MAALVSLSTAANVAAMISLADMAFKSGTQVYDLYCRYRDASVSMAQLVDEIQAATSNTAQVRIFMQEFEASAFAIDNGHALPQIQQLLCLIDQEFKLLRKFMQDASPSPPGSWLGLFQQVTSHIRWSLDDHKITASCTRLHRLSTHMSNALGVTGRRNEIVLRNELTATRAEVVRFADTAKRLQDHMDILAAKPSTNTLNSDNSSPATRLPFRSTRSRLRTRRLAGQRHGVRPALLESESDALASDPLPVSDTGSELFRKIFMWQQESGVIDVLSLAPEDTVLPLIHVKGLLRIAISDIKLSAYLLISDEQAERIAFIVDQLLAHSHIAAAASLSRGSQRFATAKGPENARLAPSLYNTGTAAQGLYSQCSEHSLAIVGGSQKKHGLNRLWTTQSLSKKTPWGTMKAEIYLIGDRLNSEILCFRMSFSPDRQLSNVGVVIDYTSHRIESLVRLDYHQPSPPDQQRSKLLGGIDLASQRHLNQQPVERLKHVKSFHKKSWSLRPTRHVPKAQRRVTRAQFA